MTGSMKTGRKFGLDAEEVKALQEEYARTKKLPNPYRAGGCYHMIVAALVNLGINKAHKANNVMARMQQEGGRQWTREWKNKEKRAEDGKDAQGRFLQNLRVLQRVQQFGKRLLDVGIEVLNTKGVVIDLTRDSKGDLLVTLNTDSNKPKKPGRVVKAVKKESGKKRAK